MRQLTLWDDGPRLETGAAFFSRKKENNEKYCYTHRQYAQPSYSYSMQAIDFIIEEIRKDPQNIVQHMKSTLEKNKEKRQPQGQRNS